MFLGLDWMELTGKESKYNFSLGGRKRKGVYCNAVVVSIL